MTDRREFLFSPNVRVYGAIGDDTVLSVLDQLDRVRQGDDPVVFELTTPGGDPDAARRIGLEIRLCRQWHGRETFFVGKTIVMSAGIVIMAAFPREARYLTRDAQLLVHERRMEHEIRISGPMGANIQILSEQLELVKAAVKVEKDGFAEFAEGSAISAEDLYEKAKNNLYLTAEEALRMRLIEAII